MTFEKKTLVLNTISGQIDAESTSFLPSDLQPIPMGKDQHVIIYGSKFRKENDPEEALTHSLNLRSLTRKMFVGRENILFENEKPKLIWEESWKKNLDLLKDGDIGVSLELVRIFQRVFDIQASKTKRGTTFLLKGKKENPSRIRGLKKKYATLVGRKKELHTLMEVVEQSFEDQGQIASIVGDAGLGKTRLVVAFKEELKKKKIKFYEGYFSLDSDLKFRGFHQIVQQILEGPSETIPKWTLSDTESIFLNHFLHPEDKNSSVKDLSEQEITQSIFHSIQKLFASAGKEPFVIILEDFHWAGNTSVELMELLAQSMEKTKIAFVLVHRPTFVPTFQRRLNYHQIQLKPLGFDETMDLVKNALLLNYVTNAAIQTLCDLSLGNPLYVEEVLKELINQKKLNVDNSNDIVKLIELQFPKGTIPSNIYSLITARLDLLSLQSKEVLQWLCAFGYRENQPDFELFLQTLGIPNQTFQDLFTQGYVEEASMFPEHKYKFCHDLLYETIKLSIPEREWLKKNQEISIFLYELYKNYMPSHGDRIAEFFIKGIMGPDSFRPIFEAASIAFEQKRYTDANKYFAHAHSLYSKFKIRFEISLLFEPYAESLLACGEKEKAKNIFSLWRQEGFPTEEIEVKYYKLYLEFLFTYHEDEKLLEESKRAISKFDKQKYKNEHLIFQTRYFQALTINFKFDEGVHIAMKLLRQLNNEKDLIEHKINTLYSLGFITQQTGYPNVACYFILIAQDMAEKTHSYKLQMKISQRIGYLFTAQCYYKEAVRAWSDIVHFSKEYGYTAEVYNCQTARILNLYFLGKYKDVLEEFYALDPKDDLDWDKKFILNWIGQAYLAIGAYDKAKEIFTKHRYFPERSPYIRCNLLFLAGNYHFMKGEYKNAKKFFGYAKKLYQKINQKIYAFQMQLMELRCRLLLKEITTEEAAQEFNFIVSHREMRNNFYLFNTQMLSFWFARHGCEINFKPSEDVNPMDCNAVYLRMQMYVEKIKWLEFIGEKEKAATLKEEYTAHRQKLLFTVPKEYQQAYLENPFYSV